MKRTDQIFIGRAGEFLAAYILERSGLRTTHVDLPGDDLWCDAPHGLVRVQVKATCHPFAVSKTRPIHFRYHFQMHRVGAYDGVFVLCALDRDLCLAKKRDDFKGQTVKIHPDKFTKEAQEASIKRAFKL